MDRSVGRKEPCPCGSKRRYKNCCYAKGFHFVKKDDGSVDRIVPISSEAADVMERQREKFVAKFGRAPGPDDRLFFDLPDGDELHEQMAATMREAGVSPQLIYAFEKTGLMVTPENKHLIPQSDLEQYEAAIDEYLADHDKD